VSTIVPGGPGRGLARTTSGSLQRVPRSVVRAVNYEENRGLVTSVRIQVRTLVTGLAAQDAVHLTGIEESAAGSSPAAGERVRLLVDSWLAGTYHDISGL
jgi:hypothetical protein